MELSQAISIRLWILILLHLKKKSFSSFVIFFRFEIFFPTFKHDPLSAKNFDDFRNSRLMAQEFSNISLFGEDNCVRYRLTWNFTWSHIFILSTKFWNILDLWHLMLFGIVLSYKSPELSECFRLVLMVTSFNKSLNYFRLWVLKIGDLSPRKTSSSQNIL